MFYGRGAGGDPTASAVLGDLIDAAVNLPQGLARPHRRARRRAASARSTSLESEYYINLDVADRPGVLAAVAGVFGAPRRVDQLDGAGGPSGDEARLVFITHLARERDVAGHAAPTCASLDAVRHVGSVIRVLGRAS